MKSGVASGNTSFVPTWRRTHAFNELIAILGVGLVVFLLASYFDVFEMYRSLVRRHGLETWEADDFIFLLVFFAFALSFFSLRRWRELQTEVAARRKAERLKDEFIGMVSHELRTPLTTIREGVSQVVDGILGPTSPRQDEYLKIVLADADRLARIIGDLLDVSKIEAGRFNVSRQHIDMAAVARHAADVFAPRARARGLDLHAVLPKETVEVYADPDRILQVWENLVGNAIKFTSAGGVHLRVEEFDDFVKCSVKDTGPGIDPEELPMIFTRFHQGRRTAGPGSRGTGLGLAIAKAIVESHGGTISVESRPNEGSTFTFILPKTPA